MQDKTKSVVRVLVVDAHPVVTTGCRALFASDRSVEIEEAFDAKTGHQAYLQQHPDVTVVHLRLPDLTGFELTRRIRKDDPGARIVMLSVSEDPAFVVRAVEMGIQGYVSKSDDPTSWPRRYGRLQRAGASYRLAWPKRRPSPGLRSKPAR
ncbi:response regulator transcription factor [Bradyrhizobium sp. CIAT3101]|nr:response regulator transcription factor [Bradyrhizobium sp. CIAT3101]WFU82607.1 response regulator transcription factor [Bradyrhizobium sp. CIAT3101]